MISELASRLHPMRRRRRRHGQSQDAHDAASPTARVLSALKPGESGVVVRLTGDSTLRTRLTEMGVLRGDPVKVLKYAPLGDPMELLVSGYHLSLRKRDAECVVVDSVRS